MESEGMKVSNLLPQIVITVLIAAGTTIGANYTQSKIDQEINSRQNEVLSDLEQRLRNIEATRYTNEQANQDREHIIRELDRIYAQLEKLEKKL